MKSATYVVSEIMLCREHFIRRYGVGIRVVDNITIGPIALRPSSCLRMRPGIHAQPGRETIHQ